MNSIIGVLWLVGGLLLMSRKSAGRIMLILLACVGGVSSLYSTIASLDAEVPGAAIGSFIGLGVAALVLGLTMAGPPPAGWRLRPDASGRTVHPAHRRCTPARPTASRHTLSTTDFAIVGY
ncbi:hypothetical protein [Nocardia xishanensis]